MTSCYRRPAFCLIEYSGGLVQPDRRGWCTRSGKMVHGDRADGARPPCLKLFRKSLALAH